MATRLVSDQELLRILNQRLQEHPNGGPDCSFPPGALLRLKEPDDEGCNWRIQILRGSGMSSRDCEQAAHEVVRRARLEYSLKD